MKGVYVLMISLEEDVPIETGRLGNIHFKKGVYAYAGSAQSSLGARLRRHLSKEKKLHWHIDYVLGRPGSRIIKIFIKESGQEEECRTASKLTGIGEPVKGFGCSDCRCGSHLFRITGGRAERLLSGSGFYEYPPRK